MLRIAAILFYATPVFFAGMMLKLIFSVWLQWLPVAGRATDPHRTVHADVAHQDRDLPDRRDPARQPRGHRRRSRPRGTPRHRARPPHRRRLPPTRAHERHRHPGHRLRRCGPLARRERVPAGAQARLQARAHPHHHRDRLADRAAARRRGADGDHFRVEGSRLPARPPTSRPATSSPCRASWPCSPCSWPSPTSSST